LPAAPQVWAGINGIQSPCDIAAHAHAYLAAADDAKPCGVTIAPHQASYGVSGARGAQVVDADTQKAMMAWYYKKQEQEKVSTVVTLLPRMHAGPALQLPPWRAVLLWQAPNMLSTRTPDCNTVTPCATGALLPCVPCLQSLAQDDDDSFTHSVWANSKSLKQHFAGIGAVRLPH
jgi:hypothetical protein